MQASHTCPRATSGAPPNCEQTPRQPGHPLLPRDGQNPVPGVSVLSLLQEPRIAHLNSYLVPFCYRLNACAPLKFPCWNLTPKVISVRRWVLWEVMRSWHGAPMMGLVSLLKRPQRAPLPLLPCEDTVRRCHLWTRNRVLTRKQIYWHLDLGLLASDCGK